jgi:tyrosyl-DNA phosphodiesterase-1
MRLAPSCDKVAWFLLTSANLSKAAWGVLEKKGTQLRIRSYEIGVLLLPNYQDPSLDNFILPRDILPSSGASSLFLPVPVDFPLTSYASTDGPWIWDEKYTEPDCRGNIWTPS